MTQKIKLEKDFKRPWGGFIKFIDNKPCTVKILYIKEGESLSLQYHKLREEFWYLISGKIRVTIGKSLKSLKKKTLKEGQFVSVPKKLNTKTLLLIYGIAKTNSRPL